MAFSLSVNLSTRWPSGGGSFSPNLSGPRRCFWLRWGSRKLIWLFNSGRIQRSLRPIFLELPMLIPKTQGDVFQVELALVGMYSPRVMIEFLPKSLRARMMFLVVLRIEWGHFGHNCQTFDHWGWKYIRQVPQTSVACAICLFDLWFEMQAILFL